MLKRSPGSKYITIATSLGAIAVVFVIFSTINTWRNETIKHGNRIDYFQLSSKYTKGEKIKYDDLIIHTMYSNDAPKNAIKADKIKNNQVMFADIDIAKNSILLDSMIVSSIDTMLDDDTRMIFIPTSDIVSSDIAKYADIIATFPNGFGSDVIATDAEIIYAVLPSRSSTNKSENTNPGYFVRVTSDEATTISTALSTGELHFAYKKQ